MNSADERAPNPREWLIVVAALFLPIIGDVIGMRVYGISRFGDPLGFDPWSVWRSISRHMPALLFLSGMVGLRRLRVMEGPYRASLLRRVALVVGVTWADWGIGGAAFGWECPAIQGFGGAWILAHISSLCLIVVDSVQIAVFEETARSYLIRRTPPELGGAVGGFWISVALYSAFHAYFTGVFYLYQVATSGFLYGVLMWRTRDTAALATAHAVHDIVALTLGLR